MTATMLINCKTSQDYQTPYEYEGPIMSFGTGGGFSGRVNQFTLLSNGQLFKGTNLEGNVTVMDKIDKDQCAQLFSNYELLGFDKLQIDNPGNMYFFVKMKEVDTENKLVWGGTDVEAPEALKIYHNILMTLTVQNKNNSIKGPAAKM